MEAGTGIYVNCGSYRPKWLRSKRNRVRLHFDFSLEMPMSEAADASVELRESIQEVVSRWSRSCYVKLKKQQKKGKR